VRALGLVLLLCSGARAGGVAALVEQLGTKDYYAAYRKLRDEPPERALGPLVKSVGELPMPGQRYAMLLIERYPEDVSRPALEKLLRSGAPFVRLNAARELDRMGETAMARVIEEALRTDGLGIEVYRYMLSELSGYRDAGVNAAVRRFVTDNGERRLVVAALDYLHDAEDRGAISTAEAVLDSKDASIRAAAAGWLMRFGQSERATQLAKEFLDDELDYLTYLRIQEFLRDVEVPHAVLDAAARRARVETSSFYVGRLLDLLVEKGYAKAASVIRELIDHEDEKISEIAFERLSRMGGAFQEDEIRKLLESDDPARRLFAADALRKRDDLSGYSIVLEAMKEATLRRDAAKMLGSFRRPESVPPLLTALMDSDSTVRSYAARSLEDVWKAIFPYRRLSLKEAGYVSSDPDAQREAALRLIRAWWKSHKDADW